MADFKVSESVVGSDSSLPLALPEDLVALTSLRFLAALGVLLLHAASFLPLPSPLAVIAMQGQAGVGFFFVLSGFILMHVYAPRFRHSLDASEIRRFYGHRFARIFPLHLLALVLCTWWGLKMYAGLSPVSLTASWLSNLFLVQVWIPKEAFEQAWNAPAWSVACEASFYAVFPWLAYRMWRIPVRRERTLIAASFWVSLTAFVIAFAFARKLCGTGDGILEFCDYWMKRNPLCRVGEFILGCCLYRWLIVNGGELRRSEKSRGLLLATGLIWLVLIFGVTVNFRRSMTVAGVLLKVSQWYLLPLPAFAMIIVALSAGPTFLQRLLSRPTLVRLGEASYALYMLHWALWRGSMERSGSPLALRVVLFFSIFPLALLAYRYVESPARRALRKRFEGDARFAD